jgi:septum formation protein
VVASSFEEHGPGRSPRDRVVANAQGKVRDIVARTGIPAHGAVLGADTEVVLDGMSLGKPEDPAAATRMLRALAGRTHEVVTAVVLATPGAERTEVAATTVRMRPADEAILEWYIATGEWRDRAGGYAIQGAGAALVTGVEGDHSAVVGLPVPLVADLLRDAGLGPWGRPRP